MNQRRLFVIIAALVAFLVGSPAFSLEYPEKTIKVIVPYPAGGSSDQLARMVAPKLRESLGQNVYVENLSGGNTMIGTGVAARAAPDGYTILVTSLAYSVNLLVTKAASYKTDDFIPIAPIVMNPYLMMVNPSVPATNIKELLQVAKQDPAKFNAVGLGPGGVTHLLNERFAALSGVPITTIQYRGAGPALIDLLGGQVQFFIDTLVTSIPFARSGKLRALGVTSEIRSKLLPDIPTLTESGYPGMTQEGWFGAFVPAGTPKPIVDRLNYAINEAMASREVQEIVTRDGLKTASLTPAQFLQFITDDTKKWANTVRTLKIQIE